MIPIENVPSTKQKQEEKGAALRKRDDVKGIKLKGKTKRRKKPQALEVEIEGVFSSFLLRCNA